LAHPPARPAAVEKRLKLKPEQNQIPPELLNVTITLAEALASSEAFVFYHQAQSRFNSDPEAQALLEHLSLTQANLRKAQARNEITQTDLDQLRTLQGQAQANEVITNYSRAQQNAITYLREINKEISELIGVDFASLARKSSCC
jgi:cell fate (sporulation/competence/biofilm development) regulator YlbF (YheA/YmcA/DUF963 family)